MVNKDEKVQLQSWVGKHLPENFEGDPHSLGEYVAELVTGGESDRAPDSVHLVSELSAFLGDNTEAFVGTMVDAISSKSYVTDSFASPRENGDDDATLSTLEDEDRGDDEDDEDRGDGRRGGRSRDSRSRSRDRDRGRGSDRDRDRERGRDGERRRERSPDRRRGGSDMGPPIRKHCFSFERNGRCDKGIDCSYAHGNHEIGMPRGGRHGNFNGRFDDGYRGGGSRGPARPWTEKLLGGAVDGFRRGREPSPYDPDEIRPGPGKGDSGLERALSAGADTPREKVPRTKILIRHIPHDLFSFDKLHGYFKTFGNIEGLDLIKGTARRGGDDDADDEGEAKVTFATEEEAEAANKCPDAILGSRFITSTWFREPVERPRMRTAPLMPIGKGKGMGMGMGMGMGKGKGVGKGLMMTQLCQQHQRGSCSRGIGCTYAHSNMELGMPQADAERMRQGRGGPSKGKGKGKDKGPRMTKYCNEFMQSGTCVRGASCTYAHGDLEIGMPQSLAADERLARGTVAPMGKGKGKGKGDGKDDSKRDGKGEGKGNAEGEDGASDDDGGPPEGSGEDADDNGKTKGKGADVGFGKGKGKMGKGFGKIGGKGCFGKGKGKKGSEGPWAEGMDPVEAPAEFSEKGSNTWVKGQSTEAAGAKRGATVLGGGTWKRPRMEAGAGSREVLESQLEQQRGMMAKLGQMKESAARQKIIEQLQEKMDRTTEALAAVPE